MNTLEASPMVASESVIGRIPIFGQTKPTITTPGLTNNISQRRKLDTGKAPLTKYLKVPATSMSLCNCPHVIVADDDPFQLLYYQNLFQKSLDFDQLDISQEDIKIELCSSGEELLSKYNAKVECGCQNLRIVITDYQMGDKKLNGFETAEKLRGAGYKGPVFIRTSETKEDLLAAHPDLEIVVTAVIEKRDSKAGKEVIMKYLRPRKHSL